MRGKTRVTGSHWIYRGLASMRPPLNAGENGPSTFTLAPCNPASMRPPLNAGENQTLRVSSAHRQEASMRPPLNAGENRPTGAPTALPTPRFNEAPAECGGKPREAKREQTAVQLLQ